MSETYTNKKGVTRVLVDSIDVSSLVPEDSREKRWSYHEGGVLKLWKKQNLSQETKVARRAEFSVVNKQMNPLISSKKEDIDKVKNAMDVNQKSGIDNAKLKEHLSVLEKELDTLKKEKATKYSEIKQRIK